MSGYDKAEELWVWKRVADDAGANEQCQWWWVTFLRDTCALSHSHTFALIVRGPHFPLPGEHDADQKLQPNLASIGQAH